MIWFISSMRYGKSFSHKRKSRQWIRIRRSAGFSIDLWREHDLHRMRETANQSKFSAGTKRFIISKVGFKQLAPNKRDDDADDVHHGHVVADGGGRLLWVLATCQWTRGRLMESNEIPAASGKSIDRETKAKSFWSFRTRASPRVRSHFATIRWLVAPPKIEVRQSFNLQHHFRFTCAANKRKSRLRETKWEGKRVGAGAKGMAHVERFRRNGDEIGANLRLLCVKLLTDFECTIVLRFVDGAHAVERLLRCLIDGRCRTLWLR